MAARQPTPLTINYVSSIASAKEDQLPYHQLTMLAQLIAPAEMAAWAACLAFAVMLFNQMAKAKQTLFGEKNRTAISPQPLEVKQVPGFVTEGDYRNRLALVEKQLDELRADRKADVAALHEKFNGVAREVSELAASVELQNQRLAQIDAKLDRMIERQARSLLAQ